MFEQRLDSLHAARAGRHGCDDLSIDLVRHTNRDGFKFVEHIQFGDDEAIKAIHFGGIAQ